MTRPAQHIVGPLTRIVLRETGFASAVLAIWLMSLLAPMHLVSRVASDLRLAGYETASDWSLCIPITQADEAGHTITLCPGKTVGGGGLLPVDPPILLDARLAHMALAPNLSSQHHPLRVFEASVQPRAPPMAQLG
ncbi:hypothetical protein MASR1M32_22280 [Rhodobacter sp.]